MIYSSTRNKDLTASPVRAVLEGIAPDGGLYMADPAGAGLDWRSLLDMDARHMSSAILSALLPGFADMEGLVSASYEGKFETEDLTPLVKTGDRWILELFRGPTSAFKDVALSVLPRLITAAEKAEGSSKDVVILTATSGDTGKAALEGFHDVPGTRIVVFYPYNGTSRVQELQMTTQKGSNVRVCAVRGNFDDAQTGVKRIFSAAKDMDLKGSALSSANSINIGRLAPQIMYYFKAYADLVKEGVIEAGSPARFTVPTGNFGDILAGYIAKLMGLPVERLICASNKNNVLTDFLTTGVYDRRREFYKTTSPSMDILVSSNLERLLWLISKDEDLVASLMKDLSEKGYYTVGSGMLEKIQKDFGCGFADDEEAERTIGEVFKKTGYLMDPHTAVAWAVSEKHMKESPSPMVVLSTASPFKFPAACLRALGEEPAGDEFLQMERLSALAGIPAPRALAGLKTAPVLHRDVIDKEEMPDYVFSYVTGAPRKEER